MPRKDPGDACWATWTTAWGRMGAVVGGAGLRRVVLPHYTPDDLKALLGWEHPGAVFDQSPFEQLIELTRRYFNGRPTDFGEVACDLPSPGTFAGMVMRACRAIPYGQTRSYLQVATMVDRPDSARAVATAMGRNAVPLVIPCHRVVYADGRPGGFSAAGGQELKQRMLSLEAGA